MLEFWISLLVAFSRGDVVVSEISAITSDTMRPLTMQIIEWDCFYPLFSGNNKEICFVIIEDGKIVETGP